MPIKIPKNIFFEEYLRTKIMVGFIVHKEYVSAEVQRLFFLFEEERSAKLAQIEFSGQEGETNSASDVQVSIEEPQPVNEVVILESPEAALLRIESEAARDAYLISTKGKRIKYAEYFQNLSWENHWVEAHKNWEECQFIFKFTTALKNLKFNQLGGLIYQIDQLHTWLVKTPHELLRKSLPKKYLLKKKKLKKWRLKKRKLKKLKIFRKLKKVLIHLKLRKKFSVMTHIWSNSSQKLNRIIKLVLVKKIPLTKRVVNDSNLELFYKFNKYTELSLKNLKAFVNTPNFSYSEKEKDLIIFLRNYHQKPYWKLRQARIVHWNFFFNKTLRKQRYKKFINLYIKKYNKFDMNYIYFVNYFNKLNISWSRLSKLTLALKSCLFEVQKSIVTLPLISSQYMIWGNLKKKSFKLKKKISRWSYLNYKRYICPWLQRKKNFPQKVKHIVPKFLFFKQITFFDALTNCLYVSKIIQNKTLPFSENFKTNLLIKLHMYRYKSNINVYYLSV